MPCTLRDFHFNPIKLGQIIKQLCVEKDIRPSYMCKLTGITRDTFDNILRGSVHDVKFEQLFKICCVLEVPVAVIEMLMIRDEDIDFEDQVVMYDAANNDVMPVSDVDAEQVPVPTAVVAVAEAVAAAENPPLSAPHTRTADEYIAFLQAHIERLTALLDKAMTH
jgi:DNA-binding Xre family transcriptional regulator